MGDKRRQEITPSAYLQQSAPLLNAEGCRAEKATENKRQRWLNAKTVLIECELFYDWIWADFMLQLPQL